MNDEQLLRYSRHLLLDEIDITGQERLLNSHVLVIGAGGLGCACAPYLAAAGIGKITLIDHDHVDLTNLQRQIMHQMDSIGMSKVASGKRFLKNLNPTCQVQALEKKIDEPLLEELIQNVDVVVEATGVPEVGARVTSATLKAKKHVAVLNVEMDVTIGPLLTKMAADNGVLYAVCHGDEPVEALYLVEFARDLSFEIVMAGKGKNNPF
ncbi:MAG: hypothetical protein RLZZ539_906, partial [Pseudomonadota bacterium]